MSSAQTEFPANREADRSATQEAAPYNTRFVIEPKTFVGDL